MDEVTEIMEFIQRGTGIQTDIIWGNGYDESLEDALSVTIVATGLNSEVGIGKLIPDLQAKTFELKQENEPVAIEINEVTDGVLKEDIPFEVNGEPQHENSNRFSLDEDIDEASTEAATPPPSNKKQTRLPFAAKSDTGPAAPAGQTEAGPGTQL